MTIVTLSHVVGEAAPPQASTAAGAAAAAAADAPAAAPPTRLRMPRYLAPFGNGLLAISDSMNQRIVVIDPDEGGAIVKTLLSEAGSKPGMLCGPTGIACEGNHLYLAEGGNHRIQKVRVNAPSSPPAGGGGNFAAAPAAAEEPDADDVKVVDEVKAAGQHGPGARSSDLWCPQGIAVAKRYGTDIKEIFVCDHVNGRVVVFDAANMDPIRIIGEKGSEEGQLLFPMGVAIDAEDVFISELGNHRISCFGKRGEFKRCFGEEGKEPGQLHEPRGLAFVRGWLFVVESSRLSILTPHGEPKQTLELPESGLLWGVCKGLDDAKAYVSDCRAGRSKVFCLDVVGEAYDDGSTPAERAAREAALKRAAEEERLKEWQASRSKGGGA